MTRPFQRGDIVRHRANGMVGRVAAAYTLGDGCFLEVRDPRGSSLDAHELAWEHHDPDALLRPVQRLLAGIAMAAAMKAGADHAVSLWYRYAVKV